jgi:hypothetical protein
MDTAESVEAWRAFCALLTDASAVLERDDLGLDDFDRGEGLRYLARLTENAVGAMLGTSTSVHPSFRLLSNGFGMDNPDNHYLGAPIDAEREYVVRSRRGNLSYLSFAAQNQNFAAADKITGGAGHLQGDELATDADGRFEIIASQTEHPGNWLRLAADSSLLLARQTRADPTLERFEDVEIECIGVDEPPAPLVAASVPGQLLMTALYTIGASSWFADWVSPWRETPNALRLGDPEHQRRIGGDPNILSQSGYFCFEPDEALLIEVTPPACAYWNFQVANMWAECLDTRRRVWINNHSARLEPDGSVRIVVAHTDPGHPNWIDTAGHRHGTMHMRFVNSAAHPLARGTVVPLAEVPPGP